MKLRQGIARQDRAADRGARFFGKSLREMSLSTSRRKGLVESSHVQLSIARQCELLSINRSAYYYQPVGESPKNLELMRLIDEQHLETASAAQDISLPATRIDHRAAQPSLVRRYQLHSVTARLSLSGGYHGLGQP